MNFSGSALPVREARGKRWRASILGLGICFAISGCGGSPPNPVSSYQPGDERRSCEGLKVEIASNEAEIARLLPYEDATGKNVALGVAGAFLIVPWFFMDFKDGEAIEVKALRRRNDWLREIAAGKDCVVPAPSIKFEDKPKPEEIKS